jgi:hypothetical protein
MDKEKSMETVSSIRDLLQMAPLLVSIEKQVISILIVHGLVKVINNSTTISTDDYTFYNIELTNKGAELISENEELEDIGDLINTLENTSRREKLEKTISTNISEEDIDKYREVFPPGCRGSRKLVRAKLERFLSENNCSVEEIIEAAKLYVRHNTSKSYNVAGAHYFLYKRDMNSRVDESKCEEFLEQVRQGNHTIKDWRDETV